MNTLLYRYPEPIYRDKGCDIARGIGIVLVVWGHLKSCPVHDEIFLFHMPLFFLLSGSFLSTKRNVKSFCLHKIRFLIGPFFVFYTASFIYGAIRSGYYNPMDYVHSLHGHLMAPNAPLWFLLSLFEVSLLAYFVEKFIAQRFVKILIVLFVTLLGYYLSINGIRIHGGVSQALLCYVFYQIGYWIRCCRCSEYLSGNFIFLIVIMSGYILGVVLNIKTDINLSLINHTYILFFIPALCGSLIVIYISNLCANYRCLYWLAYLGRNSLLIMCTHIPLIITYYTLGNENELWGGLINLLILFPLSLGIGLLFKKYFSYFFKD